MQGKGVRRDWKSESVKHARNATYQDFLFDTSSVLNLYSLMKRDNDDKYEEEWEYGDIWKQGTPDEADSGYVEFIEILRGDTGKGYDDSYMLDLISYLGSRGIRATYDSFSLGLEPAAIKTYVLKVESGRENEAISYLKEKR